MKLLLVFILIILSTQSVYSEYGSQAFEQTDINLQYSPKELWSTCYNTKNTIKTDICANYIELNDSLFHETHNYDYLINIICEHEYIDNIDLSLKSLNDINILASSIENNKIEDIEISFFSIFQLIYINSNKDLKDIDIGNFTKLDQSNLYSNLLSFYKNYQEDKYSQAIQFINIIDFDLLPLHNFRDRVNKQIVYSLVQLNNSSRLIEFIESEALKTSSILNLSSVYQYDYIRAKEYYKLGKYEKSLGILIDLYEIEAPIDNIENEIAIAYYSLGKYSKYLEFQLSAEKNAILYNDIYALLNIYRNLHIYHKYTSNWKLALDYINKAKEVTNAISNNKRELSALYRSLGDFYWESDRNLNLALTNVDKALKLVTSEENFYDYINLLNIKAKFYEESMMFDEAIALLNQVSNLSKEQSSQKYYLQAQIDLAYIFLKSGNVSRTKAIITTLDTYDLSQVDFLNLIRFKYAKVVTTESSEKIKLISDLADQVMERAKNSTISQGGYWNLEKEYYDIFQAVVDEHIKSENFYAALQYLDKAKTINDANYFSNPLIASSKLSDEDIEVKNKLNQELSTLRKKLLTASSDEKINIQTEIDRKSLRLSELRNQLSSSMNSKTVPVWAVNRKLRKGQAILHFTELDNALYKTTISNHDITIDKLELDEETSALYDTVAAGLSKQKSDLNGLFQIYQHLELQDIPDNITELIIFPDSRLLRIPLDILPTNKPDNFYSFGSARYLIENYHTSYFTSIKEFFENDREQNSRFATNISAFGVANFDHISSKSLVPLPFAEEEITSINNRLGNVDRKALSAGKEASKSTFFEIAPGSKVLHLATHSEVSDKDPLYSTLYFNTGYDTTLAGDDGIVYAYELYNLNLRSELVFLNSCSSGSGNYMQGTGIMGINRALRYAGAKSLILNLWPVNDVVAADFAADFYQELSKGKSKSEALRDAKLNQLRKGSADPHYWGVYMLMGNPTPVFNSQTQSARILPIITLLLISSLLIARWQRSQQKAELY